jgi:anti-sigma factor ChrR (cupin superfamily)
MTSKLPHIIAGMAYRDHATMDWEHQTPKSRRKILKSRPDLYLALIQWDAGFQLPAVDHHGGEELVYVVNGTFVDQHRESGPGTFIRCDPGTSHQPSTPDGCTFIVIRDITEAERQRLLPQSKL